MFVSAFSAYMSNTAIRKNRVNKLGNAEININIFQGGKNMKKKALACLLAAVMALSLAACGGGSDDKKTSEKTETQDTNASLEATNQLIEAEDPSALPETAAKRKDTLIAGVADFAGVFSPLYCESKEDQNVAMVIAASLSVNENMKYSKFKGTKFKNCLFFGCNLQDADFLGASFENVYFISCNLKNIKNFVINDNVKIIKEYPEILLSKEMEGVLAAMSQNSKLEKYHILTMNQKKNNYWMLEILLQKYHEQELKYFFQKLLVTNKNQFYTIHDYILALSNYYKR